MSLFYYDADTLSPTMYDLNFEVRNSIILKQITVNASRHIIRQYHFSYNAVPELGIYLLVSVEETGNSQDGVVRRYVLQHEPPATLETASVWSGGPGPGIPIGNQCVTGDFNGDGKTDLACYTGNAGNWHVAHSTGSGWNSPVLSGGPGPGIPIHNQCATGNFNGDGKTDIACYTGNAGNYHVWLSGPGLAHALRSIEFPTGVVVTYDYTWSDNSAQRFLPEVTPVLRSIKVDADGGAPPTILMFSFRSGYFHAPAREFRGFAQAEVTYPIADDGKRRILLLRFHQGAMSLPDNIDFDAPIAFMKGRPYRSETQNDNGGQYNIITTEYTQLLGGNTFVRSRWNVRVW